LQVRSPKPVAKLRRRSTAGVVGGGAETARKKEKAIAEEQAAATRDKARQTAGRRAESLADKRPSTRAHVQRVQGKAALARQVGLQRTPGQV
jgi:hypothetical protein